MNAIENISRSVQRAICLVVAAFIVSSSLTLGAYGVQSLERDAATAYSQRA